MPIIQMPNPLTAASDAVGGFTAQKNENIDRAEAKRQRDATLELERQRLASQEKYQASELDLQGRQLDESHRHALTVEGSQALHDSIAQATADFEKQMRPVTEALARAQLKAATDSNAQAPLKEALLRFQVQGAKVDVELKKKYGPQEADAAIKEGQMKLKLIAAEIASTNASTFRTMHPITPGGSALGQAKLSDARAESDAEFQVNKSVADDLIKGGKTPDEVRTLISSSQNMSNVTKLKLIRYLQTVKPAAAPAQGGPDIGGMLRGAAGAIFPFAGIK